MRGGQAQVLFSEHDLGGALARGASGTWEQPVVPGGDMQREQAIRLAVNIAMYVLCSNYKDDQVHAPFLMRRRALSFAMTRSTTHLGPSGDLAPWAVWLALALSLASFAMLLVEMRQRHRGGILIAITGLLAVSGCWPRSCGLLG